MSFDIQVRGVMLLETTTIGGDHFLYRILIPRAATQQDEQENWPPSKTGKARRHLAGVVLRRGAYPHLQQSLAQTIRTTIGSGNRLPTVDASLLDALPNIATRVAGYVLREQSYIEIFPRGKVTVAVAQPVSPTFNFARGATKTVPVTHFNVTLSFEDVPQHEFAHLPPFIAADTVTLYNSEHHDPTPEKLDELTPVATCEEIGEDDDFYWIYGMYADQNGDIVTPDRLAVPVPDCSHPLTPRGAHTHEAHALPTPRVSSCFVGIL